jgi:8-amino-3,8-dideoxy-alpha-D-manno-octulosonate transaminase
VVAVSLKKRAIPVLCEIDDTWNMDPQDLENCITERTGAIVAIHMAGTAADIIPILNIAKKHGIPVLEDCSQASGASVNGRMVGSFGEIATFSLQYNKNFTTGEGGIITTSNEVLHRKCVSFQDVGFERDEDGISVPKGTPFVSFGVGCRLDEIRGAIGLVQLHKLPETCKKMRRHQQNIRNSLLHPPGIRWRRLIDAEGDSGYCLGWILENKQKVKPFLEAMRKEGIPVTSAPGGVHQYRHMTNLLSKIGVTTKECPWTCPFNKDSIADFSSNTLPISNDILDRSMMLTMPPLLTQQDEEDVIKAFQKVAGEIM